MPFFQLFFSIFFSGYSKYFIFMHVFINILMLKKVCEADYGDYITRYKISGWKENLENIPGGKLRDF